MLDSVSVYTHKSVCYGAYFIYYIRYKALGFRAKHVVKSEALGLGGDTRAAGGTGRTGKLIGVRGE